MREKNDDLLSDQQHLEKLMDSEWNDCISHHSLATFHGRKFNQVDLVPLTEDLFSEDQETKFGIEMKLGHFTAFIMLKAA